MNARQGLPLAVASALGAICASRPRRATDADARLLPGKRRGVCPRHHGLDYLRDKPAKMLVTIEGDEIRVCLEGTKSEQGALFTIDPEKNPKHIDFIRQTRDRQARPWRARCGH